MKKILLAMCCAAAVTPLSARTVTFMSEFSSYKPTADEEVVTVPVTWTGRTLYCDAFNLFIGGGSKYSAEGGIFISNTGTAKKPVQKSAGNVYLNFYPTEGVTIKKITVRRVGTLDGTFEDMADMGNGIFEWTGEVKGQSDLKNTKKFFLKYVENLVDGVDQTDHTKERMRMGSISVEYEGETARCHMPVPNITNEYVTNEPITFTCDEPGAKIYYAIGNNPVFKNQEEGIANDEGFTLYDGTPIVLSQPTDVQAYAYVEGKWKSGLFYRWFIPGPEDSNHAVFDFTDPSKFGLTPSDNESISNIELKNNGITWVNTTTAASSAAGIKNQARLMSTAAYGHMMEVRYAKNNGKNNNKLKFTTDNPDNSICAIVMIGNQVLNRFSAATTEQVLDADNKKTTQEYGFPDNVEYVDENAENHAKKIFRPFTTSGNTSKYVAVWRQSEDYEGEDPANKVIFDMFDDVNTSSITKLHVFYYGDSSSSGINNPVVVDTDSEAPVEFYNLQGIKVSGDVPGLYIRRQGKNSEKILIR